MGWVYNLIWQGVLLPVIRAHPGHVCAGKQVLSFKKKKKSQNKTFPLWMPQQRYQG